VSRKEIKSSTTPGSIAIRLHRVKTARPLAIDDLRINPRAVLLWEASRPDLVSQTTIHMLGGREARWSCGRRDHRDTVVNRLGGLLAARRYLAPPPAERASTVYISPRECEQLCRPYGRLISGSSGFVDGSGLKCWHRCQRDFDLGNKVLVGPAGKTIKNARTSRL
jgi:hypothetical protein